jgi:hypothetical protein
MYSGQTDTKYLPVDWRSNKKAWMTHAIFEEWLVDINNLRRKQNRKILLLVNNAMSHHGTKEMTNVKVKFLPLNLTSEVQPLDQGITQAVKSRHHHKQMLQNTV